MSMYQIQLGARRGEQLWRATGRAAGSSRLGPIRVAAGSSRLVPIRVAAWGSRLCPLRVRIAGSRRLGLIRVRQPALRLQELHELPLWVRRRLKPRRQLYELREQVLIDAQPSRGVGLTMFASRLFAIRRGVSKMVRHLTSPSFSLVARENDRRSKETDMRPTLRSEICG
jgi:hypothetical protein